MTSVFHRDGSHTYPNAVSAAGMYIYDDTGKSYLDMCGGAAVSCLGHQHPMVLDAVKAQVDTLAYAHTLFFSSKPQEHLARRIADKFSEPGAKVYFSSGGSEAVETAVKFATQYWQALGRPEKHKIISREQSYHGNTLGALSLSGNEARRRPMNNLLHHWPRVSPCYAYRDQMAGESDAQYVDRLALEFEETLVRHNPEQIAAFIAEPVVGASLGAVPPVRGYFKKIRALCDQYDILFIADEVMCGTGRTGSFFAHEQEEVLPDLVTLAKGIGGGYQPLAATVVRQKIVEAFKVGSSSFSHGHTYIGHASACAAGCAVMDAIETEQLLGSVRREGQRLVDVLEGAFCDHPYVGDIRGRGLLQGLELVADKVQKSAFEDGAGLARNIRITAMKHGLMCYPGGGKASDGANCHILLAPPFIVKSAHMEEMVDKLKITLLEVFGV